MIEPIFYCDRDVAKLIGMSSSWVRGQRFMRCHGRPHVLDIDPVRIGSKPLYAVKDVTDWIGRVEGRTRPKG